MRAWLVILIMTAVAFVLQLLVPGMEEVLGLTPSLAVRGALWQFVSYLFIHGGIAHIALNMFAFLIFAPAVEEALGTRRFLALYFLAGIGSALLFIALTGITNELLIGASGAVFGVLAAYGVLFPKNRIFVYGVLPIPALAAVFLFAALELALGLTGLEPGIANFGHLGGIVTGLALTWWWAHHAQRGKKGFEFIWE